VPPPDELVGRVPEDLVSGPRPYGLHGTLLPPAEPAPGVGLDDVAAAVAGVAARHAVLAVALRPGWFGPWLALVPAPPPPALDALCADLVRTLHPLRRPPGPDEVARRRASGLSPRQDELLGQWGYPFVFDEFRFHLTLAGPVPTAGRERIEAVAAAWFAPALAAPWSVQDVAVVAQPARDQPFSVVRRVGLAPT
jgi:hypothetical protein